VRWHPEGWRACPMRGWVCRGAFSHSRRAPLLRSMGGLKEKGSSAFASFKFFLYRGADKSLARTDNSYVKIKHISCLSSPLKQCFSTAGPRPGTGSWHQLYRAARDSPGIYNEFKCNFIFVNMPHRTRNCTNTLYDYSTSNY